MAWSDVHCPSYWEADVEAAGDEDEAFVDIAMGQPQMPNPKGSPQATVHDRFPQAQVDLLQVSTLDIHFAFCPAFTKRFGWVTCFGQTGNKNMRAVLFLIAYSCSREGFTHYR